MRFLFEDYVLDEARHELRRDGEIVPVEARVFDLLAYLIRNRERVVSQEDLRLAVWEGRIVSISTISSSLNAVRSSIGDSGDDQRLIRTIPRKGFRFVAPVVEQQSDGSPLPAKVDSETAGGIPGQVLPPAIVRPSNGRAAGIFAAGAAAGALAAMLAVLLLAPSHNAVQPRPLKKFDASVVPLVDNDTRLALANYAARPDHKALAIGGAGQLHVADGVATREKAQEAALQGCFAKLKRPCRLYADGADVVWSEQAMPLPAQQDIRTESLGLPLDVEAIPLLLTADRNAIADRLRVNEPSWALALSAGRYYGQHSATRREAVRLAVERCSFIYGRPCLILAVDGSLTIQIPKTRRIVRTLLPSTDAEIPDAEKERIAKIYQGREWRALARGEAGSWHAVADAPSEEAAIAAALKACMQADSGCRLHAIGNFVVADE